jgi:splicing factor U2AF subunit
MKLALQRVPQGMASVLLKPSAAPRPPPPPPPPSAPRPSPLLQMPPTCALQLSNMVVPEDLRDEQLYEELMEDVADELNSHGTVRSIVIPRPLDANDNSGGFSAADIAAGKWIKFHGKNSFIMLFSLFKRCQQNICIVFER